MKWNFDGGKFERHPSNDVVIFFKLLNDFPTKLKKWFSKKWLCGVHLNVSSNLFYDCVVNRNVQNTDNIKVTRRNYLPRPPPS